MSVRLDETESSVAMRARSFVSRGWARVNQTRNYKNIKRLTFYSGWWFTIPTELFFVVPRYNSTPIAIELITHPSLKPRLPC
jgi:hypothetical protein